MNADGTLFGTLCAIDPSRQPGTLLKEQDLLELCASLLSTVLELELKVDQETRRSEHLEMEAQSDALTQLLNRRAWDQLLLKEEERCRRYGSPAAVMIIDLDKLKAVNDTLGHAAGDGLIRRVAETLRKAAREVDIVARLGGDEFGIISVECNQAGAEALLARIREALAEQQIEASLGIDVRVPESGLMGAWEVADQLMY